MPQVRRFPRMGQRVKAQDLREMLNVARKLRHSAGSTCDHAYTDLFVRAAAALEERAAQLAYDPADLEMDDSYDPDLYRPVDFRC